MSLTSTALVVMCAVVFVILLVGTLLTWSRLQGPRPARHGTRFVMLLANQVVAVFLVGLLVNDSGGFYTSWSQLIGTVPHGRIKASVQAPRSAAVPDPGSTPGPEAIAKTVDGAVRVGTDPTWSTKAQWPTRGRLESVTISGATSQLSSHAYVYLPPQYFQARYAGLRFPALEVLTGYPGRDADLIQGIDFPKAMLQLIDSGAAPPMVLVMTRPAVTYPRDTECTDVPAGPQVQTFFSTDLPAAVAHAYRVRPTAWGSIGISTGGYCAVKLAMLHPDLFYAAVALSGYYTALKDYTTGDLWGGSPVLRNLNDLEWRLQHLPAPPISVLTTVGSSETGVDGLPDMQRFDSLVKPPMRVSSMVVPGGGHTMASFNSQLPQTLTWLCKRIPPAGP